MLQRLDHALLDRRNKFLGNIAAADVVFEFELAARRQRLDAQLHARVLSAAAGLLLVRVIVLGRLPNGLAIRHLRLADVRADVELALHAIDDDFEMQLAHAGENRLAGIGIGRNFERRIFLRQLGDRHAQLFLIGLGLRLDRELNHRRREVDRFEQHRVLLIANRIAGDDVLQPHRRADVAGENLR